MSIVVYKLVQVRPAPDAAYEPRACARIRLALTNTVFYEPSRREKGETQCPIVSIYRIVNASHAHFCALPKSAEHAALVEQISDIYEPTKKYDSALSILNPCIEYRANETFYGRRVSFVLSQQAVYSIEFGKNKGKHMFEMIDFPLANENIRVIYTENGAFGCIAEFDRISRVHSGMYLTPRVKNPMRHVHSHNHGIYAMLRRQAEGELDDSFFTPEIVAAQQIHNETVLKMIVANQQQPLNE